MKRFSIAALFLLSTSLSWAADQVPSSPAIDAYLQYLDTYPNTLGPCGDASRGEIEIIRDRQKMTEIERASGRVVGVVAQDKYWIWINDAVKFPNGNYSVYGRMLWTQSLKGPTGVAVLAILPDGKIVLNRNFRHATRSWEYELPRGARDPNETVEETALRETKEETGMEIASLYRLGEMAVDTAITNAVIPIFLGKVISKGEQQLEDSEAIAAIESFSVAELKQGYIDGYLTATVDDKSCKINLRDPFLAFGLFQAELRSLLPTSP